MKKVRINELLCNLEGEENYEKIEYCGKGLCRVIKVLFVVESGLEKIVKL